MKQVVIMDGALDYVIMDTFGVTMKTNFLLLELLWTNWGLQTVKESCMHTNMRF